MRAVLPHCLPWIRSPPRAGRLLENLLACATQHGAGCGVQFVKEREPGSLEQGAMEQHTLRTRSPLLRITDGQCAVGRDCVGRQSAPESDGIGVCGHGTSVCISWRIKDCHTICSRGLLAAIRSHLDLGHR